MNKNYFDFKVETVLDTYNFLLLNYVHKIANDLLNYINFQVQIRFTSSICTVNLNNNMDIHYECKEHQAMAPYKQSGVCF